MRQALALVGARLVWAAAILLVLSFALFGVLAALPGDPVDLLVTANPNVRPDDIARLKKLRGLDKPWPVRWARWLVGHPEALAPPQSVEAPPIVVEMPVEGAAEVTLDGQVLHLGRAGIYDVVAVVRDAHGLEAVRTTEVLVAPTLSRVPTHVRTPGDEAPVGIDESERQLGGSTEDAAGIGNASTAQLAAAARAIGRALVLASPRTFTADDDGVARVATAELSPDASLRFEVVQGPGRFANGAWQHAFDGPGQAAIVYEATTVDGTSARGAFVVDHGLVPDPQRYHRGALFVLAGDTEALGYSATYKRPVWELLFGARRADDSSLSVTAAAARHIQAFGRVQNTLALMLPALLLSLALAVPLGTWAAWRRGGAVDATVQAFSVLSVSMPAFWLGIMAMLVFAAKLQWLPASGLQTPGLPAELGVVLADRLRHAVLPVTVLAVAWSGTWLRYVRTGVAEVLPQDFMRTARAKGLGVMALLSRHALRNALLPLVTVLALATPQLFAGALLTETVFAWPGVGRLQYEAILNNDSYVAVVVFLVSAALVLAANLAADLLYLAIDPRLRRGGA